MPATPHASVRPGTPRHSAPARCSAVSATQRRAARTRVRGSTWWSAGVRIVAGQDGAWHCPGPRSPARITQRSPASPDLAPPDSQATPEPPAQRNAPDDSSDDGFGFRHDAPGRQAEWSPDACARRRLCASALSGRRRSTCARSRCHSPNRAPTNQSGPASFHQPLATRPSMSALASGEPANRRTSDLGTNRSSSLCRAKARSWTLTWHFELAMPP